MSDTPQLARYKKLLTYLEEHLHEELNISTIEEVCHYSYRNINRIFEALHQETIGKYIKRLRLEKAAQYLKYSGLSVAQIAYEVGFEDRSAFSKAFKKKYQASPQQFRNQVAVEFEAQQKVLLPEAAEDRQPLQFAKEQLPDFDYLFLEYRGSHHDHQAMESVWTQLATYATQKGLLSDQSIFMMEIIDDAEISDHIRSRYHLGVILEQPLTFEPEGLFRVKSHSRQRYVKFTHQGSPDGHLDYYQQIFAFWMLDVGLELADLPLLEFYPNYNDQLPAHELITEMYLPVM